MCLLARSPARSPARLLTCSLIALARNSIFGLRSIVNGSEQGRRDRGQHWSTNCRYTSVSRCIDRCWMQAGGWAVGRRMHTLHSQVYFNLWRQLFFRFFPNFASNHPCAAYEETTPPTGGPVSWTRCEALLHSTALPISVYWQ